MFLPRTNRNPGEMQGHLPIFPSRSWLTSTMRFSTISDEKGNNNTPKNVYKHGRWSDPINVRKYLSWAEEQLGIKELDHWYQFQSKHLVNLGGNSLLKKYGGLQGLLKFVYPDRTWYSAPSGMLDVGFWDDKNKVMEYITWVGKVLGIGVLDDWYTVTREQIEKLHGESLLVKYGTLTAVLMDIYPEHSWLPWKFPFTPGKFWEDEVNVLHYFEWLADQLQVVNVDHWCDVNNEFAKQWYGSPLILKHGSLPKVMADCYPEHDWHLWKIKNIPASIWDDERIVRRYLKWIERQLGMYSWKDWYNVRIDQFHGLFGSQLIAKYNKDLKSLLITCLSEYPWEYWKWPLDDAWWDVENNVIFYMEWLAHELKIQNFRQWHDVKREDMVQLYGQVLFEKFGSIPMILATYFPDIAWEFWRFEKKMPEGLWNHEPTIRGYLAWCEKKLNISTMEDWYFVTRRQLEQLNGSSLLSQHGSVLNLLAKYYPDYNWDMEHVPRASKAQQFLYRVIMRLLPPDTEIKVCYKHPQLQYATTNVKMELDIFIPSLKLAIEYQGQQHYHTSYLWEDLKYRQKRDQEKKLECERFDLTLLQIPYWWDRTESSLAATIAKHCGISLGSAATEGTPIPEEEPESFVVL